MEITFDNSKKMKCYEKFVNNPESRDFRRNFCKEYTSVIADAAVKRHNHLKHYPNALAYNQVYGKSENRIEIKQGQRDKESFILKVRISGAYRKFFYSMEEKENEIPDPLLTKNWKGQFDEVTHIHVFDVNKHNYNKK